MVQIFEWIKGADDEAVGTDLALLIYKQGVDQIHPLVYHLTLQR